MRKISFLVLSLIFIFSACGDDTLVNVDDDFTLLGTWNFDKIESTTGVKTDTDENPNGVITFNADGTGIASFTFGLCGTFVTFEDTTFTYIEDSSDPPQFIVITFEDGQVFTWELTVGNPNNVIASFPYSILTTEITLSR